MIVELISVGTEILTGNITNTNVVYLARKCAALGLDCYYQDTVGNQEEHLKKTIQLALTRSDIIILVGGLGFTAKDITKETVSEILNEKLIEDVTSLQINERYFQTCGVQMKEVNYKKAMSFEHSYILNNENGIIPGYIVEKDAKRIILLPESSRELVTIFENGVTPYLKKLGIGATYTKIIKVCGLGEKMVEETLIDMVKDSPKLRVTTDVRAGEVHIHITAHAEKKKNAKELAEPVIQTLKKKFGKNIYATKEEETLEAVCYKLLLKNHLTVTAAESCTGGLLAGRLINIPGVSTVMHASFVTYSDEEKHKILGVKKSTLKEYTAVSKKVAKEMAIGAAQAAHADIALSVTGIAGPDGGTEQIPIGTVYIGCYIQGKVYVKKYCFSGNRARVRECAVTEALILLRSCILKKMKER